MKKNFLFRGVSALGAMLLLATSVMPGLQYAYAEPAEAQQPTWYYIHDKVSWDAAYGSLENQGPLYRYYIDYPDEDLISTDPETPNKTATFNDRIYVGTIGDSSTTVKFKATWQAKSQMITNIDDPSEVYYMARLDPESEYYGTADEWKAQYSKFHGSSWALYSDAALTELANKVFNITELKFEGFEHTWNAAVNAPGAKYPWVAIDFPADFAGTISLTYNGETETLIESKLIANGGYVIVSIPTLFGDGYKLDADGKTTFNPSDLTVTAIPMNVVPLTENTDWYYVNNQSTWNAAYQTGKPLYRYYVDHPDEDLISTDPETPNKTATFNDRIYVGTIGDSSTTVKFKATWQAKSQMITNIDDPSEVYYMARLDPESEYYGTADEWKAQYSKFHGLSWPLYSDAELTTPVNKVFNITELKFEGFEHTWGAAFNAAGAKYPWIVLGQDSTAENNIAKTGKIAFKYGKNVAYPYGDNNKTINETWWGVASIPTEFGYDNLKTDENGAGGTFDKSKFSVVILNNPGNEIELSQAAHKHTVTFGVNGGSAVTEATQNINCGGVATSQDTTKEGHVFLGWFEVLDATTNPVTLADTSFDFTTPITEDITLVAQWAVAYTITLQSVSNGTISTTPSEKAAAGAEVTLTATPASNYNFSSWTVKDADNNAITVTDNKFTMPAKDVTVSATFTSKPASYSGGGGSSRTSTTKTDDTKKAEETTKDTAKVDEQKADETKTDESKADETKTSEEAKAAADAQALKDGYSQEFIDAYNFARKNNITTKDTIREADMDAPLTRIAMAKMLSQYAINVLGKEPDTTKVVPTFPDVDAKLDADYNNGVTLAYQLGIMGIGIEKFRPFDLVTRAEFGTALSRMLFGTVDGEGNEWYKTHLDKLMLEKIITNDDPNLKELRGYVMIMLMRSASDK